MKLALQPTVPGSRAVLRQPAPSAPRQCTLEANGVDCWGQCSAEGLPPRAVRSRSGGRAGELGEDRDVGMEPDRIQATNAKRCQRRFMRAGRALPLQCGDRALADEPEPGPDRAEPGVRPTAHAALGDDQLQLRCEQAVRSYDPCISCATHFLRLEIDRG